MSKSWLFLLAVFLHHGYEMRNGEWRPWPSTPPVSSHCAIPGRGRTRDRRCVFLFLVLAVCSCISSSCPYSGQVGQTKGRVGGKQQFSICVRLWFSISHDTRNMMCMGMRSAMTFLNSDLEKQEKNIKKGFGKWPEKCHDTSKFRSGETRKNIKKGSGKWPEKCHDTSKFRSGETRQNTKKGSGKWPEKCHDTSKFRSGETRKNIKKGSGKWPEKCHDTSKFRSGETRKKHKEGFWKVTWEVPWHF